MKKIQVAACVAVKFLPPTNTLPARVSVTNRGEHQRMVYSKHICPLDTDVHSEIAQWFAEKYIEWMQLSWKIVAATCYKHSEYIFTITANANKDQSYNFVSVIRDDIIDSIDVFNADLNSMHKVESCFFSRCADILSNWDEYSSDDRAAILEQGYEKFGNGSICIGIFKIHSESE